MSIESIVANINVQPVAISTVWAYDEDRVESDTRNPVGRKVIGRKAVARSK